MCLEENTISFFFICMAEIIRVVKTNFKLQYYISFIYVYTVFSCHRPLNEKCFNAAIIQSLMWRGRRMLSNIVRMPLHICPATGLESGIYGPGQFQGPASIWPGCSWLSGPLWGGRPGYSREGGQEAIYKLAHESFSCDLPKITAIYIWCITLVWSFWCTLKYFFIESPIRPLRFA